MKYGICEWSMPLSGLESIPLLAPLGFEGMQIGEMGGRVRGYPLNSKRIQETYRELSTKYAMQLHSLNLGALLAEGHLNYAATTRQGRLAQESIRKGVEASAVMGIRRIVLTVDAETDETINNCVNHLKNAQKIAAYSGIGVVIESAQPIGTIKKILSSLNDEIKVCMDTLNPIRFHTGNPEEQIREFGEKRIDHIHLKDSKNIFFSKEERACVLLGSGDGKFHESAQAICEIGFDGWLISENYYCLPPLGGSIEDMLRDAEADMKTMRRFFQNK